MNRCHNGILTYNPPLTEASLRHCDACPIIVDPVEQLIPRALTLNAKHVIPFASFIWLCHEENFHMNCAVRTVEDVAEVLRNQTTAPPVVPFSRSPVACLPIVEPVDSRGNRILGALLCLVLSRLFSQFVRDNKHSISETHQ